MNRLWLRSDEFNFRFSPTAIEHRLRSGRPRAVLCVTAVPVASQLSVAVIDFVCFRSLSLPIGSRRFLHRPGDFRGRHANAGKNSALESAGEPKTRWKFVILDRIDADVRATSEDGKAVFQCLLCSVNDHERISHRRTLRTADPSLV